MIPSSTLHALQAIAGSGFVRTDSETIRENSTDATKVYHPADVVVLPDSSRQVSAILKLAFRERIPVVSRGGGVGFAGGAIPIHGGIVISTRRMNRILEIDPIDLLAVAEAGVVTADLHRAVEEQGLFYPPDPASLKQSTLGGNVAHNAGGPRAFKYGVTRQYLLGLEAVLANGDTVDTGGRFVKSAVGYDLTSLLCGSEGTLGIITKVILRLLPKPETSATVMALFSSARGAAESANRLIAKGIVPSKLELIDGRSLAALRDYIAAEKIEVRAPLPNTTNGLLLVEVDGDRASVRTTLAAAKAVLRQTATRVIEAEDSEDLWAIRRHLSAATGRIRPNKINEDIVVPRSRVPDYLDAMRALEENCGLPIACFGHVGDGNIHVNLMLDASNPSERQRAEQAKRRIFETALEMSGTISGEHGIGIMKADFLSLALQPAALEAMRSLKRALDPTNVLNPGKIFR